jgi:Transposase and inactivated derivatives
MKRKRTYQAIPVEQVRLEEVLPVLITVGCVVALDVAKEKFVAALATAAGEVLKLFRFKHPTETSKFLELVTELQAQLPPGQLKVAMEPTGTYGDAIRHQLLKAEVPVWMVSPKRTHDSQALFDNVQSLHDPKSAVLVAKLCAMGLATEWKPASEMRRRLRALVELRAHHQQQRERCFGRLEALQARHWPEFGRWLDVRVQKSALRLLEAHGSPATTQADPDTTRSLLVNESHGRLSKEVIEGVVSEASTTSGVPTVPEEEALVKHLSTEALELGKCIDRIDAQLAVLASDKEEGFAHLQTWMGTYTAAVIVTLCDPRQYANARQFEKACGLNLREKSSGERSGRLSITKRGPALVRQVLYLFALRMIKQSGVVRAWYMSRRGYTEDSKQRAVVAVMRKLVKAMFHVARGAVFDETKLFDTRRLEVVAPATTARNTFTSRTTPRSIARRSARAARQDVAAT